MSRSTATASASPDPGSRLVEVAVAGAVARYALRRRVLAFDNRGAASPRSRPGRIRSSSSPTTRPPCSTRGAWSKPTSTATPWAATSRSRSRCGGPSSFGRSSSSAPAPAVPATRSAAGDAGDLDVRGQLALDERIRRTFPTSFTPGWRRASEEYEAFLARRLDPHAAGVLAGAGGGRGSLQDVGVDVERIDVPALVVHGELDRVVPVANGRLLAARLPAVRSSCYPTRPMRRCSRNLTRSASSSAAFLEVAPASPNTLLADLCVLLRRFIDGRADWATSAHELGVVLLHRRRSRVLSDGEMLGAVDDADDPVAFGADVEDVDARGACSKPPKKLQSPSGRTRGSRG